MFSTTVVYYPSLKVPFLLDDYFKIVENPDIKRMTNLPSRLIYPYDSPPSFNRNDPSRPLLYLTLTLNYHFSELEPYGYHVLNIAVHALVVLLIFLLAWLIFPIVGITGITLPLLSAMLFAVHPLNVNVVTYVMGRAASLATVFYLSSVIFFILARRGFKWGVVLSAICFVFALASNQLAVTLPAIILLADYCLFSQGAWRRVRENWKQHAVYWGILALYLGMRMAYFGKLGDLEAIGPVYDPMNYLLTQWVVLWKYAGMCFLPIGLSFEHFYGPINHLTDAKILAATTLYGILCVGLMRRLKSSWQNASFVLFGILWFLITLLPTSSVFPTTAAMAENRVYLPSIGLCLMMVFIGDALIGRVTSERSRMIILLPIFGAYILSMSYATWHRNVLYQDPIRIWTDVIRRYPNDERAHRNIAIQYANQRRFDQAAEECEKALAIDPSDFEARNNLAAVYDYMGRYKESLAAFQEILKEHPDYAGGYANMGRVYEQLKDVEGAANAYENAIRLNPTMIEPMNNLANIDLAKGRRREAATLYQAALRIDPNNATIRGNYERIANRKQ